MFKSVVYKGDSLLGEVEIYPNNLKTDMMLNKYNRELRISHFSQPSERCPPLAVLHTIAPWGLCLKMEAKPPLSEEDDSSFFTLHFTCLRDSKTAVVPLGDEELHLVAMSSGKNLDQSICFWGFIVAPGLYNSCLVMLNLRCLGIVFDLDETLVVANTMRSFEDRIDALQRKINTEMDPQRLSGMLAEVKRYQDDKIILKQYVDSDQVVENGKVIKVQSEVVPALSDDHQPIVRPLIRLREKNIILTRINPVIRDTSVLVRLRPAWEDLRSYLTARGRKRFEVYVCTMAERDYALEMWRLLDPESNLITSKELLDRIVCVKAGSRKSLLNVFHDGICHPKMALVIDDRLKVWDEKDQPRVHVVPAFAPYYAPQAEANNVIPVLCVARNVACNVRGGFFKDFDDGLLQRISEVFYEDDLADLPSAPDVSNYLISEDDTSASSKDPLNFEGITGAEVERRLKQDAVPPSSIISNVDPRQAPLQHLVTCLPSTMPQTTSQGSMMSVQNKQFPPPAVSSVKPLTDVCPSGPSLQGSPAREEGEVPESELDPDTRRRLLILQHGQDTRDHTSSEPPFPVRPPPQAQVPVVPSRGSWFPLAGEMDPKPLNRSVPKPVPKEFPLEPETLHFDKHRARHPSSFRGGSMSSDRPLHENRRLPKEAHRGSDRFRRNQPFSNSRSSSAERIPLGRPASSNRDLPAGALEDIAMKCGTKVEFRPSVISSMELQFCIQVWFGGEKIGEGLGRTRKEAQHHAAEHALRNLANKYLSSALPDSVSVNGDINKLFSAKENGFPSDMNSFGHQVFPKEETVPSNSFGHQTIPKEDLVPPSSSSESSRFPDPRLDGPKKLTSSVSTLKELCMREDLALVFEDQSPLPTDLIHEGEVHAQVVIGGEVLGKGIGLTWDEAKMQAAEEALQNLKATLEQDSMNNEDSSRSFHAISNKRLKTEFARDLQRIPSSGRLSNNVPPVL